MWDCNCRQLQLCARWWRGGRREGNKDRNKKGASFSEVLRSDGSDLRPRPASKRACGSVSSTCGRDTFWQRDLTSASTVNLIYLFIFPRKMTSPPWVTSHGSTRDFPPIRNSLAKRIGQSENYGRQYLSNFGVVLVVRIIVHVGL